MSTVLSPVLSPIGGAVREILSGRRDGRSQVAEAIAEPPGAAGWFTPADPIWTVHGSVATFVGGIRALLLQALHPLALAGVMQHSTYRDDPLGRLQRTGAFIAATTFGSSELARATTEGVRRMHRRVRGTALDGRPYSADDPDLLMWVHVTLTESMLVAYQRYGSDGEIDPDAYVANMAVVGSAMGVSEPPTTVAGLCAELRGFQGALRADAATAEMVEFIFNPPLPRAVRPGYSILAAGAVDLLHPEHRSLIGRSSRIGQAGVAGLATSALLQLLRLSLTESPAKAAGERRLGLRPVP